MQGRVGGIVDELVGQRWPSSRELSQPRAVPDTVSAERRGGGHHGGGHGCAVGVPFCVLPTTTGFLPDNPPDYRKSSAFHATARNALQITGGSGSISQVTWDLV